MSRLLRKAVLFMVPLAMLGMSQQVQAQATDVDCNKCVNAGDLATNSVNKNKIKDGAVKTEKIENGAVVTNKLANEAVESHKIAPGAVKAGKLGDGIPNKMKHGGYDLDNTYVDSEDATQHFDAPSSGGDGDTTFQLNGGEDVLVIGSLSVYTEEFEETGHLIAGAVEPCYKNWDIPEGEPDHVFAPCYNGGECYASVAVICYTSTSIADQENISTSYLFRDMPAGLIEFGLCSKKDNYGGCSGPGANYNTASTKISVILSN